MVEIETSTTIDRPVDEVFRFVEDAANMPKWDSDLVKATQTSDGPLRVGTTLHLDIKPFMGVSEGEGKVLTYRPNEEISLEFEMGKMKTNASHLFAAEGSSTRFTRHVEVEPRGFLKVMQPMMKPMIRKRNEQYLVTLKNLIEGRPV